ncbi:MAG: M20 family metallopeptidase [Chloroflexota bacterium]|nr:M20 family metallopeptidase [Chloroflexota bacterium]
MKEFLDYAQDHAKDILDTLKHMVELESFTTDKKGTDSLSTYIIQRLNELGAQTTIIPQEQVGNHVVADIEGGNGRLMLLCHMDTVWPKGTIEKRPFTVENDLAYGPGILDMKAGIAIALHALETLRTNGVQPRYKVKIVLNSDEEIGSTTSRQLIEDEARKSDQVFCLEPGAGQKGALKTGRKGVGMFQVKVTGRAAHAGNEPEKGISAIEEMAHQILRLHSLTDFSRGTTVNVGVVQGGAVRNQVAASAEALIDLRVTTTEEGIRVEREILNASPVHNDAIVEVTGSLNRPPMERTESTVMMLNWVKQFADPLGISLEEIQVGGGSDAQFVAALGIPVLDGMGGVGEGPHADHENIVVSELPRRVALLASILAQR